METLNHSEGSFLDLPKPKPPGTYRGPTKEKRIWKDGEKPWQVSVAAALLLANGILLLVYTLINAMLVLLLVALFTTSSILNAIPFEEGLIGGVIFFAIGYFFSISLSVLHIFRAINLFQYPPGVTSPPYFTALFGTIFGLFAGIPLVPINILALVFMSSHDVNDYIEQKGRLFYETSL